MPRETVALIFSIIGLIFCGVGLGFSISSFVIAIKWLFGSKDGNKNADSSDDKR